MAFISSPSRAGWIYLTELIKAGDAKSAHWLFHVGLGVIVLNLGC